MAVDLEGRDRLDPFEPLPETLGLSGPIVHRDKDSISSDPLAGLAPEGEAPSVPGMIAEHRS